MSQTGTPMSDDRFILEILEQPRALRDCFANWVQGSTPQAGLLESAGDRTPSLVVFSGMGSSMNACYPACAYLNHRGVPAVVIETAELLHFARALLAPDHLLVVVSQSGESIEPVRLLENLPSDCSVMSLTNGLANTVASRSGLAFDMHAGPELTVSTKTYTCAQLSLHMVASAIAGERPEDKVDELENILKEFDSLFEDWRHRTQPLVDLLKSCPYISLLGRGPSLASALDGAQMLKEAAHRHAEAVSGGQFRHGPIELVSDSFGYILFPGTAPTRELMIRLGGDIAAYGARLAFIGGSEPPQGEHSVWLPVRIENPYLLPILEIVPIQLLAWSLARFEGRTVNAFDKMTKVIRTE